MQLNASHVAAQEGSSFLKTVPERRPREQSMLEAPPGWGGWGGRQRQHQLALNWKGVGAPSQASSDGGAGCSVSIQDPVPNGP